MRANSMRLRRSAPSQNVLVPSACFTTISEACAAVSSVPELVLRRLAGQGIVRAGRAGVGAVCAEENIGLGDFEVAGLHQLFLHHVLDLLDVDEGLLRGMDAFGDRLA